MDCSTPGFPVLHCLPELAQIHVHWVGDAIQLSHPLLPPSPPALNVSQHQGLFQWVSSSHQVAKVLEFKLQHQSIQCVFRVDFRAIGSGNREEEVKWKDVWPVTPVLLVFKWWWCWHGYSWGRSHVGIWLIIEAAGHQQMVMETVRADAHLRG